MNNAVILIKNICLVAVLLATFSLDVAAGAGGGQIVISLGETDLSRSEFKEQFEIAMVFKAIETGVPIKNQDQIYVMEHRFLDQRAQDMVLSRLARDRGISVSEQELDQYLTEFMQKLGFGQYNKTLFSQLGFASEAPVREYMRQKLVISRLIDSMKKESEASGGDGAIAERIDKIMSEADIRIFPDVVDALPR